MKDIKPMLQRYLYQEAVFRFANAARALLRALLLVVGLGILATVFLGGHLIKLALHAQH